MINIIPVEPWHINLLHNSNEVDSLTFCPGYAEYVCNGAGYTVFKEGRIFLCAGVLPLWGKVGDAWGLIPERARKQPVSLVKAFKEKAEELFAPYTRVQMNVLEGFDAAERFAQYLGFKNEGRMEKYGPDNKTYIRYARVK